MMPDGDDRALTWGTHNGSDSETTKHRVTLTLGANYDNELKELLLSNVKITKISILAL